MEYHILDLINLDKEYRAKGYKHIKFIVKSAYAINDKYVTRFEL